MRVKNSRQKKFLAVVVALFIIAVLYIINYIATYNTYHFSEKLVDAISSGNAKKVEKVLNDYPNGDVNKTEYRTNIIPILLQTNNNYPIQEACLEGNLKIIKLIRDRGAELNVVSGTTNDPLLFNVVYQRWPDKDSIRITEYLISQGIDVRSKNIYGETAYDKVLVRKRAILNEEVKYSSEKKKAEDLNIMNELLYLLKE